MQQVLFASLFASMLLLAACDGDDEQTESTTTESAAATQRSTPRRTAGATDTPSPEITRPDPETFVPAGYLLDQALDVSLDDSEAGQIVIVSRTVRKDKEGRPVVADVPEACPDNTVLAGESSPCAFRFEIFDYNASSAWVSVYIEGSTEPKQESLFADGITQAVHVTGFPPSEAQPQALILSYINCAVSNCPVAGHVVLTMKTGQIARVFGAFEASFQINDGAAVFTAADYAPEDSLCCPSARRVTTVGLDPATGEIGVTDMQIKPINP